MEIAKETAKSLKIDIQEGGYVGMRGPSYETPAEIGMCRAIGGDAVGMSTVPEVIAASHMKMNVLGISCITNMAAGMGAALDHKEVIETTERVKVHFQNLVKSILPKLN